MFNLVDLDTLVGRLLAFGAAHAAAIDRATCLAAFPPGGYGSTVRRAQALDAAAPSTPPGLSSAELAEVVAASVATALRAHGSAAMRS